MGTQGEGRVADMAAGMGVGMEGDILAVEGMEADT